MLNDLLTAFHGISELPAALQATMAISVVWAALERARNYRVRHYHALNLKSRKIEAIEKNAGRNIGENLKRILECEKEERIFEETFGFPLDRGRRDALMPILLSESPPFKWSLAKEAVPYVRVAGGKLCLRIPKVDMLQYHIGPWAILMLMLLSMALVVSSLSARATGVDPGYGGPVGLAVTALFPALMVFPIAQSVGRVATARRLQKHLDEAEDAGERGNDGGGS